MVSKPFQLSPIFGHVSEYAWVALKWVKIEGGVGGGGRRGLLTEEGSYF